jgi:hypothetical protein
MKLRRLVPVTALAAVLSATSLSAVPAAVTVDQRSSCVDGGGQKWQSGVAWGDEYTDTAGVKRVRVDSASWTTNGRTLGTDATVRIFDGSGKRVQQLKWTGRADYRDGSSWRRENPADPPSAPGKARVVMRLGLDGDGKGDCQTTFVQPPSSAAWWSADLKGVPVGSMGCHRDDRTTTATALKKQWDHWDNCGGSVIDPATDRIPNPPGGQQRVVKWKKPAGSDQVYQKLNRTFTKDNWPQGAPAKVALTGSPADVSGIYSAYLYIPSSDFVLNPAHGWTQFLQLKETYTDANGVWHQDPVWAMGVNNFSGQSVGGGLWPDNSHTFKLRDYQDRWVKWELRVYQGAKDTTGHGGRVELWADGKRLQTGYESRRHVGSGAYAPLSRTQAWVWIAGPYTSNQTTKGVPDYQGTHVTTYVGPSRVEPLP